jgi:predicted ATP-dependent endonuclease of OLD family
VVLVEGLSDQAALHALAERRRHDLGAEGVRVVPIGGAQALGQFLDRLGGADREVRLAGLCDAGEEHAFRRALERAGLGSELTREGMEHLGFFVCDADLEDELVRALGADAVERVLADQGELRAFRTYQKQEAHRHRPHEQQLRGFMTNRKVRYGRLLVEALDPDRIPRPLDAVLDHALAGPRRGR